MMKNLGWTFLCLALLASPVLAQTAATIVAPSDTTSVVTQPDGTLVFIKPVIDGLVPYIDAALGTLITALGALAVVFLKQHFNVVVTAAQETKLESMAKTQAGIWVAKADSAAMNASIDVGSPGIASAANGIIAAAPDLATSLGLTPAAVQQKIVGEIGKLQAASPTSGSTIVAPTAQPSTMDVTVQGNAIVGAKAKG